MKTTRNTPSKIAVLNLLNNSKCALSQVEIQKHLNGLCDRVTIYRVLDRLVAEDLIHKIATTDGTLKFAACHHEKCETNNNLHEHIHFSCEKCNKVTCIANVYPVFELPKDYQIREVNFTISGFCPDCKAHS